MKYEEDYVYGDGDDSEGSLRKEMISMAATETDTKEFNTRLLALKAQLSG